MGTAFFCLRFLWDSKREGNIGARSEVLLPSLLGIHGVQDGLSFGSVALPELLDLPLHHRIQGSEAQLQLLKVQVLQLSGTKRGQRTQIWGSSFGF